MSETGEPSKTVDYKKLRNRFGLGFVISTGLFVVISLCAVTALSANFTPSMNPTRPPERTPTVVQTRIPSTAIPITPADVPPTPTLTPTPPPLIPSPGGSLDTLTLAAAIVGIGGTCLTSATTLGGFAITTLLSVRQERRHARISDLERQRHEVELEKQRLELERMRLEQRRRDQGPDRDGSS